MEPLQIVYEYLKASFDDADIMRATAALISAARQSGGRARIMPGIMEEAARNGVEPLEICRRFCLEEDALPAPVHAAARAARQQAEAAEREAAEAAGRAALARGEADALQAHYADLLKRRHSLKYLLECTKARISAFEHALEEDRAYILQVLSPAARVDVEHGPQGGALIAYGIRLAGGILAMERLLQDAPAALAKREEELAACEAEISAFENEKPKVKP
jgi:hypothetical protein